MQCNPFFFFFYGILLSEDNTGFDLNTSSGLASNRKCVVDDFDRKGYVINRKPIYSVKFETYFGKLSAISEISDLLTFKRDMYFT